MSSSTLPASNSLHGRRWISLTKLKSAIYACARWFALHVPALQRKVSYRKKPVWTSDDSIAAVDRRTLQNDQRLKLMSRRVAPCMWSRGTTLTPKEQVPKELPVLQ